MRVVGLMVCLVACCTSCRNASEDASVPQGEAPIQLQLNWIPDAQHGGFYEALEGGHYAKEGLAVEITPGGPGTPVIPKVAMGRCDFAIANADQVLLAREQGADVVAVFAAMQNSPRCIMVHESSGIQSLHELRDLTLALGSGKAFAEYLKAKVPLTNVRIVAYSGSVAKFLTDPQFAQQGYVFSEPLVAQAQGGTPRTLMVSELGFNPYSSVVITRRELLKTNPDLVHRFVRATQAGWQAYLDKPQRANARIQAVNPEMDAQLLAQSAERMRALCLVPETELGSMSLARWETLHGQLRELNLISESGTAPSEAFTFETKSRL